MTIDATKSVITVLRRDDAPTATETPRGRAGELIDTVNLQMWMVLTRPGGYGAY
jgi:hypothetical protein